MNEYTYKVEFVAEYTNPRNGKIETDLWFGTVYRNGEQIEQHCHSVEFNRERAEQNSIAACESTIKYEQKKDAIAEQLGVSLETAEGRRAVNDAIIAGNIKNMEAHGEIISTEYFGKPAERRQPRKRFVEDQFGDIVEEIEIVEESTVEVKPSPTKRFFIHESNEATPTSDDEPETVWFGLFPFDKAKIDALVKEQDVIFTSYEHPYQLNNWVEYRFSGHIGASKSGPTLRIDDIANYAGRAATIRVYTNGNQQSVVAWVSHQVESMINDINHRDNRAQFEGTGFDSVEDAVLWCKDVIRFTLARPDKRQWIADHREYLKGVMSMPEVAKTYGKSHEAIRQAIKTERLTLGQDYRISGKAYLITRAAAERLWGK